MGEEEEEGGGEEEEEVEALCITSLSLSFFSFRGEVYFFLFFLLSAEKVTGRLEEAPPSFTSLRLIIQVSIVVYGFFFFKMI